MKYLNIIVLLLFFAALLALMHYVVKPAVIEIAKSDLFMESTDDSGSGSKATSSPMTTLAYGHCSDYITTELDEDSSVHFLADPINAWALGGYNYVINSEVEITDTSGNTIFKKFVCRIQFTGDSEEDERDPDNWSIQGISGLDL
jgi:hypothetical protein